MADPAPTPIRQAATVVLLRDGAGGAPEVLLVQRNRGAVFMADAHVFPGGRIDDSDGGDFALASAREAFEEAGVLLAVDAEGRSPDLRGAGWLREARHAVQKGDVDFSTFLAGRGLRFDSGQLAYFARWITPPTEARRFDARFFLARVPEHQEGAPDPAGEVVDFHWAPPARFLALQAAGRIKLPPPTLWHLADLAGHVTVEAALRWARSRTIIAVRPKLAPWQGRVSIVLPWDPDYARVPVDEGEAIAADHPVVTQPTTRFVLDEQLWRPVDARQGA
jgi:8-oxo-dGTP pyrophosphatase MutT (NUDIX family)